MHVFKEMCILKESWVVVRGVREVNWSLCARSFPVLMENMPHQRLPLTSSSLGPAWGDCKGWGFTLRDYHVFIFLPLLVPLPRCWRVLATSRTQSPAVPASSISVSGIGFLQLLRQWDFFESIFLKLGIFWSMNLFWSMSFFFFFLQKFVEELRGRKMKTVCGGVRWC